MIQTNRSAKEWITAIRSGELDEQFVYLYGRESAEIEKQHGRYIEALEGFIATYGDKQNVHIFSAPGRTEVGGNHTDHNYGKVLAAGVNLDVVGVAAVNEDNKIRVLSKGFRMDEVELSDTTMHPSERNHSASLVRGVAARWQALGLPLGGYDAYTVSNVLKGSGLSSSAAFEVLLGAIANGLYNENRCSAVTLAQMGQYAENEYFGKASGLLDQMTSAQGGFIAVDFADPTNPVITPVSFDFASSGYRLCIVDTKGSHADLSDEYSAIPAEMKAVAAFFGKKVLREVDEDEFYAHLAEAREATDDRAVLRAMHFMAENHRVEREAEALAQGNFKAFLAEILDSGTSSACYLQNVYTTRSVKEQGVSLGLARAASLLRGKGAWRVHGGGFAGTIQAFVPEADVPTFRREMEALFGEGACYVLSVRPCGSYQFRS